MFSGEKKYNTVLEKRHKEKCMDTMQQALELTLKICHKYFENHLDSYCCVSASINALSSYMDRASAREAQILISKIYNIIDATPKNAAILKQMPLKELIDKTKTRLRREDSYQVNNSASDKYDFLINMLSVEKALSNADHPFIILSLNAENLFNGLLTAWRLDKNYAAKTAGEVERLFTYYKTNSEFYSNIHGYSAFMCVEALCFDLRGQYIQTRSMSSAHTDEAIRC